MANGNSSTTHYSLLAIPHSQARKGPNSEWLNSEWRIVLFHSPLATRYSLLTARKGPNSEWLNSEWRIVPSSLAFYHSPLTIRHSPARRAQCLLSQAEQNGEWLLANSNFPSFFISTTRYSPLTARKGPMPS